MERAGWAVLAGVLLAAALGAFGGGALGRTTVEGPDGRLVIEYDRLWRREAPTDLEVVLQPAGSAADRVRIWVDREYLSSMSIERITPEPESQEIGAERIVYTFALADEGTAAHISFRLEARGAGVHHGRIGLEGGDELTFRQFIHP